MAATTTTAAATTAGLGLAALLALGGMAAGCDDGGGGTLVIVNGTGGTGPVTSGTPAGGGTFTLVTADAGGGTIVESADKTTRKIAGTFHTNVTLEARYAWILDAPVFVGADDASKAVTITIEAGTTIQGRGGTPPSMLVVRRGARILADGTAAAPIVFTSAQPAGSRAPGDWGGVIINGRAPVNAIGAGGALPFGEGGSGSYGGTEPNDDSGVLRHVRIEFAGHVFTSDDELNGLALQGVGAATRVDHLQVHRNADDGVEVFGGTVDLRHVLVTGALDDSLDWTFGWTGRAQFLVLQQWDGGADCGVEADNNEAGNDLTPRARPTISNLTIIGPAGTGTSNTGLLLRRGTGARISNAIVMEMNAYGLDIDGSATWANAYTDDPASYAALSGELVVRNTIFFNNGASGTAHFRDDPVPATDPQTDTAFSGQQTPANQLVDPQLGAPTSEATPNFRPAAAGPAATTPWHDPGDPFFTPVDFLGGVDDAPANDWTTGWTTRAAN